MPEAIALSRRFFWHEKPRWLVLRTPARAHPAGMPGGHSPFPDPFDGFVCGTLDLFGQHVFKGIHQVTSKDMVGKPVVYWLDSRCWRVKYCDAHAPRVKTAPTNLLRGRTGKFLTRSSISARESIPWRRSAPTTPHEMAASPVRPRMIASRFPTSTNFLRAFRELKVCRLIGGHLLASRGQVVQNHFTGWHPHPIIETP